MVHFIKAVYVNFLLVYYPYIKDVPRLELGPYPGFVPYIYSIRSGDYKQYLISVLILFSFGSPEESGTVCRF